MADFIAAGHEHGAIGNVAVAVLKFIGGLADAEGKLFLQHHDLAFQARPEHEDHGRGHGGVVGEAAADADGKIEWGPVHGW